MIEYCIDGKLLSPLHDFLFTENPYLKLVFGRTFLKILIVNRFSNFLQQILSSNFCE